MSEPRSTQRPAEEPSVGRGTVAYLWFVTVTTALVGVGGIGLGLGAWAQGASAGLGLGVALSGALLVACAVWWLRRLTARRRALADLDAARAELRDAAGGLRVRLEEDRPRS